VLLQISDANGAAVTTLNAASLGLNDSDTNAATKTFTFNYTPTATTANAGMWKFRVVAQEGSEGWVEAYASQLFEIKIPVPNIVLNKTLSVISDPINGSNNPKAIPSAVVQYSISAINQGKGATDNNSVVIADAVPDNTALLVSNFDGSTNGPIKFVDGTTPNNSGLIFTFNALNNSSDSLEFSTDGTDYTYIPSADTNGVDNNIRFFRIRPSGAMGAASVTVQPQFEFHYKVTLH
jgi:trimeric autotransporter adhesin